MHGGMPSDIGCRTFEIEGWIFVSVSLVGGRINVAHAYALAEQVDTAGLVREIVGLGVVNGQGLVAVVSALFEDAQLKVHERRNAVGEEMIIHLVRKK